MRFSPHVSVTVGLGALLAERNFAVSPSMKNWQSYSRSKCRMRSRSLSPLCWKNSYCTVVASTSFLRPASPRTFEMMSLAFIFWNVRTLPARWSLCDLS